MPASQQELNYSESLDKQRQSQPFSAPVPSKEPVDAELPRTFERVVLLRQIARGGMGEVYLGASGGIEGAERPCVVKIIRREHADDSSFLARFFDEARIQAQLQHPAIAQVFEASTDATGKPYVVVEYVEGRNLGELRVRASHLGMRFAWPDAVAIAISIGEALTHVHGRTDADGNPLDIVHRDVSPQNVMVGYGGEVKLIDFGTARGQNRRSQTVAGVVFAKPGYVAPEVAKNVPGGVPADLYAFGIILWELLTGRRFLMGETSVHLEEVAAGRRRPTSVASVVDAPESLDEIIDRLTAVEPGDRYSSAAEAVSHLVDLLKRAPSLADGQRGVRARIARLMHRLYPAEPARTRAEFARLLGEARTKKATESAASQEPEIPAAAEPVAAEPEVPNLLEGTRYQLVGELGRGGMGVVHRALHVDLGRSVALKIIPEGALGLSGSTERFRSEARTIAALSHENLVKLHDFGVTRDGRPFYAMELLEGEALDASLERRRVLPWRLAVKYGIQACDALGAAHAAGVVHCDIKPANLFVTKDGTVKLLDFGVATCSNRIEANQKESHARIIGTPEYMSPEQANGKKPDARSDIYAVGAVLYELCTGTLPHPESTTLLLLAAKQQQCVQPVRQRAPELDLPKALEVVLGRALELDPSLRYQSAEELRRALVATLRRAQSRSSVRRALSSVALGALLAGVAAAGTTAYRRPEARIRMVNWAWNTVQTLSNALSDEPKARPTPGASDEAVESSPGTAALAGADGVPKAGREKALQAVTSSVAAAPLSEVERGSTGGAYLERDGTPSEAQQEELEEHTEAAEHLQESDAMATATTPADYPALDKELDYAQGLLEAGYRVRALSEYRALAKSNPTDVRVLAGWVSAAEAVKGWGEAHRVARQWANLDSSDDAWATLARLQRVTGHRSQAVHTLEVALERNPGSEVLKVLLERYKPSNRVALQD